MKIGIIKSRKGQMAIGTAVTVAIAVVGWLFIQVNRVSDRADAAQQASLVASTHYEDVDKRLSRIETKLDTIIGPEKTQALKIK